MNYTLNLIDNEIKTIQSKLNKEDSTHLTEQATTIHKNILKELTIMKQFIHDNYHKLKLYLTHSVYSLPNQLQRSVLTCVQPK